MVKKKSSERSVPALAPGQLWKLSHVYIQIVELGKRLLQYRMLSRPGEPGVKTQMSGIGTMWGYLKSRHAQLIRDGSVIRGGSGG